MFLGPLFTKELFVHTLALDMVYLIHALVAFADAACIYLQEHVDRVQIGMRIIN